MKRISSPAVLLPITILAVAVAGLATFAYLGQADDDEVGVVGLPAAATGSDQSAGGRGSDPDQSGQAAVSSDPEDQPLGPAEFDRVVAAALEIAGGGTVTDVDRSDDLGETYEVEVVTDAGEVDIAFDENLNRVPNLRYDD